MANVTTKKILQEGPRNAIVKLTGILDTADVSLTSVITKADFTNNDPNLTLIGFRLDFVEYSMSNNAEINLFWNGTVPEQMIPIAGRGRFGGRNYGGINPTTTALGYDGSINLVTTGWAGGLITNYTVILELVKLYTR